MSSYSVRTSLFFSWVACDPRNRCRGKRHFELWQCCAGTIKGSIVEFNMYFCRIWSIICLACEIVELPGGLCRKYNNMMLFLQRRNQPSNNARRCFCLWRHPRQTGQHNMGCLFFFMNFSLACLSCAAVFLRLCAVACIGLLDVSEHRYKTPMHLPGSCPHRTYIGVFAALFHSALFFVSLSVSLALLSSPSLSLPLSLSLSLALSLSLSLSLSPTLGIDSHDDASSHQLTCMQASY